MGGREIWLTLGRAPRDSDSVTGPRASLANSMTSPLKIYKQTVVMPPHRNGTHVETVRGRGEMPSSDTRALASVSDMERERGVLSSWGLLTATSLETAKMKIENVSPCSRARKNAWQGSSILKTWLCDNMDRTSC